MRDTASARRMVGLQKGRAAPTHAVEAAMMRVVAGRWPLVLLAILLTAAPAGAWDDGLASRARAILEANCHRCHGKDGAVEGGLNFVLNRDKLVARRKILPGKPEDSPLFRRVATGKMPPPGQHPRPNSADVALLRSWIDAGAPGDL